MLISEKMQELINQQINAELYSSYLYLSMAAYFESHNWSGFAAWMKGQAGEEMGHAMKFYEYLLERGGKVVLQAIPAPHSNWESPQAVFEETYQHELKVTDRIHRLLDAAIAEKDHATSNFLQWFVKEQVEEESSTLKLQEKLKMAGTSLGSVFRLDHDAGKARKGNGGETGD